MYRRSFDVIVKEKLRGFLDDLRGKSSRKRSGVERARKFVLVGVAVVLATAVTGRFFLSAPSTSRAREKLASKAEDERVEAIVELEDQDSAEAGQLIARHVNDPSTKVARRAVYALGRMRRPSRYLQQIAAAMEDKRAEVREAAVVTISFVNEEDVSHVSEILSLLKHDSSSIVRAAAAQTLGRRQVWGAMPTLIEALRDPEFAVRARAYGAITYMIGADYQFKANGPEEEREKVIRFLEENWQNFETPHRLFIERQ